MQEELCQIVKVVTTTNSHTVRDGNRIFCKGSKLISILGVNEHFWHTLYVD